MGDYSRSLMFDVSIVVPSAFPQIRGSWSLIELKMAPCSQRGAQHLSAFSGKSPFLQIFLKVFVSSVASAWYRRN